MVRCLTRNSTTAPNGGRVNGFHSDMFAIAQVAIDMNDTLVFDSFEVGLASASGRPKNMGENGREHASRGEWRVATES